MSLPEPQHESTRVGDAERQQVVDELAQHLEAGRLDVDEHAERVELALRARYADDLIPLLSDLPSTGAARQGTHAMPAEEHSAWRTFWMAFPAMSPFVSVILFFALGDTIDNAWLFFLLIPLSGIISGVMLNDPHHSRDRERRRIKRDKRRGIDGR